MKRTRILTLITFIMLFLLIGCTTTANDPEEPDVPETEEPGQVSESPEPQEFIFGARNDIMTLDTSKMNEEMSALVMYAVNEGLIRYSNDKVVMGIAEDYSISDDGKTYTFKLRDASWADGKPVTAYDFEYSFLRTLNPETGSSQVSEFDSILNAAAYYNGEINDATQVGIKAVDEKTFEITLEKNDPFFILHLAQGINFYPIREDYVQQYVAEYGAGTNSFIGCGPFTITSWSQSSSIIMEKNDNYWNKDAIKLDKVTQLIVPDENTLAGMYDLGEVDAVYSISAVQTALYPNFGNKIGGTLQYLSFNSRNSKIFENMNLRKALSFAIDRQSIVDAVASPGSEVADSMIDPSIMVDGVSITELYPNSTGVSPEGDVENAKKFLDAALSELGLNSASELPTITYVAMDSTVHRQYAEALQARWKEVLGVNVELSILPVPQAIGALLGGEFDIFLVSVSTGVNPDTLLKGYTTGNGNNYSGWENGQYDEFITGAAVAEDLEGIMAQLQQAEAIILDEAPVAPLWLPGTAYLCRDYVKDLHYGRQTGSIEFIYSSIEK